MKENTNYQKLRYTIDNYISKGSMRILLGLGMISIAGILMVALVSLTMKMDPSKTFLDMIWMSLMATFQSNSVPFTPASGNEEAIEYIIPMLLVTFLGFLVVSIVIGAVSNGLQNKIESLRKGRSLVVEKNHFVILGWSEQIFTIINELVMHANEINEKHCVVIMGDKDKIQMEDEIKNKIVRTGKVRIVCRTGNPIELADLKIVNLDNSETIILISPDDTDDPDSQVIKTILAITKNKNRRKEPYNIIAEMHDSKKAKLAKIVGKDEVEIIQINDFVSKIIAQTCRQKGLSGVYTELLDYQGVEIYFKSQPELIGKSFREILFKYEDSAVIGLFNVKSKLTILNPSPDTIFNADNQLIAISESEHTILLSGKNENEYGIDVNLITDTPEKPLSEERMLILGWNSKITRIINELDNYTPENSKLTVVASIQNGKEILDVKCGKVKNMSVEFICADITEREILDQLMENTFHHLILLCDDDPDIQVADSKALVTLLHLRDIKEKTEKEFTIVSEIRDIRNRNLVEEANTVNDFVVSGSLISLYITQLSQNKYLNAVFEDLFQPEGSELYIKPASDFVKLNADVNFYTVLKAAADKGEVAIGYTLEKKLLNPDSQTNSGIVIDPPKSEKIAFAEEDCIIVLAPHQVII
jgi:K+/H+ antiporter YhaU regulatory subunit KhtT